MEKPKQPHDDPGSTPIISTTIIRAKKISFSIVVISLPVLYICLLHVPPSALFSDTMFWFLMSNALILIVAADSGAFASSSTSSECLVYDEYMKHSRSQQGRHHHSPISCMKAEEDQKLPVAHGGDGATAAEVVKEVIKYCDDGDITRAGTIQATPSMKTKKASSTYGRSKSEMVALRNRLEGKEVEITRSASANSTATAAAYNDDDYYSSLSDEELNRRVEEFIRRFNRQIRLQELNN